MSYRERGAVVLGAVVWHAEGLPGTTRTILPDGCLDLLVDGGRLRVAGPDRVAREHHGAHRTTGLRLSHGLGPRLLGVPADLLAGHVLDLAEVWSARACRELTERVLEAPGASLAAWARGAASDPWTARVFAAADAGLGAGEIAARSGVDARTLHRRCRAAFGYGPQHLVRVLRLQRALAAARGGAPWAAVAADTGFADQPHLAREVRALTGHRPGELVAGRAQERSGAWRSTWPPSGSRTTA